MIRRPPRSTLFPYPTPSDLAKSERVVGTTCRSSKDRGRPLTRTRHRPEPVRPGHRDFGRPQATPSVSATPVRHPPDRSEEHTSELQSRQYLVCRLLLEKKKM